MQERRTALISSAVTGKIDVRNWQYPEALHNNKKTSKEEAA
jgi:type I restriction enzyme, S subunit